MRKFIAIKDKGRWQVYDTDARVSYYPPKGTPGKVWAARKAVHLNQGEHMKHIKAIVGGADAN